MGRISILKEFNRCARGIYDAAPVVRPILEFLRFVAFSAAMPFPIPPNPEKTGIFRNSGSRLSPLVARHISGASLVLGVWEFGAWLFPKNLVTAHPFDAST